MGSTDINNGATNGNWTRDLILTMDALYHLSYRGIAADYRLLGIIAKFFASMSFLALIKKSFYFKKVLSTSQFFRNRIIFK